MMTDSGRFMTGMPADTPEWKTLSADALELESISMRSLFRDTGRFDSFSAEAAGILFDYSKNRITEKVLGHLLALARACHLEDAREDMFSGRMVNGTENRAALHTALRDFTSRECRVVHADVLSGIRKERARMKMFTGRVHAGLHTGFTGKPLTDVINIGAGGSDLGPRMVLEALHPYRMENRRTMFVSNMDGQHLADTLSGADPERTLFVIASKTFHTEETVTNARNARSWLLGAGAGADNAGRHFAALTADAGAARASGIEADTVFLFRDWVGGRFSVCSPIGLSVALQTGFDCFEDFLRGAHAMDRHFRTAAPGENLPVLMALVGLWNRNFMGCAAHAVLPYDQHLHALVPYLQQLEMESNGKSVRSRDGKPVSTGTCPVIFGGTGTNAQHAFYQLLHQGTDPVSADFIVPALSHVRTGTQHERLLSHFLAQTRALMHGKTQAEALEEMRFSGVPDAERQASHRTFSGNRPSSSILMEKLTPYSLGALVALYEHKVFCQGVLWGVNPFDQWGVELGKSLAKSLLPHIAREGKEQPPVTCFDSSTNGLAGRINRFRTASRR